MAAPGVTQIFRFKYRGNDEEWSQQYHFQGDAPSDDAGWLALITELAGLLQSATTDRVKLVRAYGYEDTDDDAVYTVSEPDSPFPLTGAYSTVAADVAPGDAAAWMRWKTGRTNTHGKPIYLRKYWHSIILAGETDDNQDSLNSAFKTNMEVAAADILAVGTDWPGLAGPDGVAPPGPIAVSTFVTTRTLKRRGARP
jgi:hypothetical protein